MRQIIREEVEGLSEVSLGLPNENDVPTIAQRLHSDDLANEANSLVSSFLNSVHQKWDSLLGELSELSSEYDMQVSASDLDASIGQAIVDAFIARVTNEEKDVRQPQQDEDWPVAPPDAKARGTTGR